MDRLTKDPLDKFGFGHNGFEEEGGSIHLTTSCDQCNGGLVVFVMYAQEMIGKVAGIRMPVNDSVEILLYEDAAGQQYYAT